MSEQHNQAATTTATATVGEKWGDPISEERQRELQGYLDRWAAETDHGERLGPFDGERLTGADVLWLAAKTLAGSDDRQELADWTQRLQPQPADGEVTLYRLPALNLKGASLEHTHLERANLLGARLEQASLRGAHVDGANLWEAHLEGANLNSAHLEGAELWNTHLEAASFVAAHLDGANLWEAHLEHANLFGAHLEQATLRETHLDGADLRGAQLQGANLWMAFLDRGTLLNGAQLADAQHGSARVADVHWGEANLAVVDWSRVKELGDERVPSQRAPTPQPPPPAPEEKPAKPSRHERQQARRAAAARRLFALVDAARAHRQLATVLRAQGITEEADRFAYRAQLCQRRVLRRQHHYLRYLGSLLLGLVSGYGYRPLRSLATYLLVILGFAAVYYLLGNNASPALDVHGAIVFSLTSFHGRGFAPGGSLSPDNPLTTLAAVEAVCGLLIEITFIATFTQRFFNSR